MIFQNTMQLFKIIFPVLVFAWPFPNLLGQAEYSNILDQTYLEYVDYLPKSLISEKSVGVLIADTRQQGEDMAKIVHPIFAKFGIDVVVYYPIDDLFAGKILTKSLADEFTKREIIQLVFVVKKPSGYQVVITPFSKNEKFVKHGDKAWKMESNALSEIADQLYRMSASLEKKNFLTSDTPEFGNFSYKIKGSRYEAYKPDLKSENLVIFLYSPMIVPEEFRGKQGFDQVKAAIDKYNEKIVQKNEYLKHVFKNYPFPHVFIDEALSDKQLKSKGYTYVLEHLHTTSRIIRRGLKYEEKQGVVDYIAIKMVEGKEEIVQIKGDLPVYKYYVRSISSGTYYLGTKWDVDITNEVALNNHIQLLITQIR